jgi:hypothetical protein
MVRTWEPCPGHLTQRGGRRGGGREQGPCVLRDRGFSHSQPPGWAAFTHQASARGIQTG